MKNKQKTHKASVEFYYASDDLLGPICFLNASLPLRRKYDVNACHYRQDTRTISGLTAISPGADLCRCCAR